MEMDRATFLVDAEGKIARVWRKVKVDGHAVAVVDAAKARLIGIYYKYETFRT